MHVLAIGFWGAFFGTAVLMAAGSLAAFMQSHHRVALTAALSSLLSAAFAVAYLGLLPFDNKNVECRFLAHVAVITSVVLGHMLLAMLGLLRRPAIALRVRVAMVGLAVAFLGAGGLLDATSALVLGSALALGIGVAALLLCIRSALRGDRLAWLAVFGVWFMLLALVGLSWIALDRDNVPWQVHIASAIGGMAYLTSIGATLWLRYSYLIELREVLAQGPRYDPVTRMSTNVATGHMVGLAFMRQQHHPGRPLVLISVTISNLSALEELHGRAALNHALFVCGSRLRRCVPADVEMGRLFDDGFLLVARDVGDVQEMVKLARSLADRLARPVSVSTSAGPDRKQAGQAMWAAQVGVGLFVTSAHTNPSDAVSIAHDMSRTALSYRSRVAWHDQNSETFGELPALATSR